MTAGPTCVLSPTATGTLAATAAPSSAFLVGGGASVVQMNGANGPAIVRSRSDFSISFGQAVMPVLPRGHAMTSIDNAIMPGAPVPRTEGGTGFGARSVGTCP